jgi:dihydropteroate synthase
MIWDLGGRCLDFGEQVQIMGILNVTPDSFYDGGRYLEPQAAVERALQMVEEGADVVDLGGESSRPPLYGEAIAVPAQEECRRVLPVIKGVRRHSRVPISIDTTKAEVARQALEAGADIINDISALRDDEAMAKVAAERGAPVILMHRRGSPATMQQNTRYDDLIGEVRAFLAGRVEQARRAGVQRVAIDPGLGFGKSATGSLALVRHLPAFVGLGCPIVVGASRKSFIWKTLGLSKEESLEGSLAVAVLSAAAGAHLLRVHDVLQTERALRLAQAVLRADPAAA